MFSSLITNRQSIANEQIDHRLEPNDHARHVVVVHVRVLAVGRERREDLDKSSGKNGDTLQLTVKVLSVDPTKYEGYILETELGGVRRRTAGLVY